MKTPTQTTLVIQDVSLLQTSRRGDPYVECRTDLGLVAFWGGRANQANIDQLQKASPPFTLTTGCIVPSETYAQRHTLWVPQTSELCFLTSQPVHAAPDPKSTPTATSDRRGVSVEELAEWRRQLFAILDAADKGPNGPAGEGVARRIRRLSHNGMIPRQIAALMTTITEMRNAAEYEAKVLSASETAAVLSTWQAILEWAEGSGFRKSSS
jgi:hypothetical protein